MSKGGKKSDKKSTQKIPKKVYEAELFRLQTEFVRLQEWARETGARIVIIFEGRDAAGKGGTIKRITEYLSPRVARIAALPAPTDRDRGQWYYQRYVAHLPTRGEIVLFDRSWYNRAGVEKVMGFCTPQESCVVLEADAPIRTDAHRRRHHPAQVLVLGIRRGATATVQVPAQRSGSAVEARRRWIWSRSSGGRTTRAPRTR